MRRFAYAAALALALFGTTATAQLFTAENYLKVVPLNAADFEVIEARGEGPRGIWCAAADFGLKRLGLPGTHRIYIKTPRGPSVTVAGRKGIVFTADDRRLSQPPSTSYTLSTRTVGQGLSLAHAIQFCGDNRIEPDDIFLRRKGS
ncbi:hypothetical protein [Sulfitobacter sp. JB4-11]|uniref:hypothetical protein n=1 Tax=Sulfitobacter rhodophyticola TaxID=3238304 RepID=UPI003510F57D